MRKRILQKIIRILGLIILVIGLYITVKSLYPKLVDFDIKNIGALVTGSITLIVGLGAVLITQNRIKKRELAEAHREKKIELYNRFNDMIFKLFAGTSKKIQGKEPKEQELIAFMFKFKKDLMFRASPKVIRTVLKFENSSNTPGKETSVLRRVDDIYRAMREDIGLSNFGLDGLELIQIFLSDKSEKWKVK